jgi:type II secretory pathway pseudopilin PulG
MKKTKKSAAGFSLVELLIVLVILVAIVGVGLFVYQKANKGSGNIYFLQNDNGRLNLAMTNVYKQNGSKIVVSGTGYENTYIPPSLYGIGSEYVGNTYQTAILASPNWDYVALRSQRDPNYTKLYMYDAASNSLNIVDQSKASFEFIGWLNGRFLYLSTSFASQLGQSSQPGNIMSYNPSTKTSITLSKVSAVCTGFVYIITGKLVCDDNASNYSAVYQFNADGSGLVKLLNTKETGVFTNNIYSPDSLYFSLYPQYGTNLSNLYYVYTNGTVSKTTNYLANNQPYHFYISSPSGSQTTWYEKVGGKDAIYVGNSNAANGKVVATLPSGYEPYAWYINTLIVSKDSNTLYKLNTKTSGLTELSAYNQSAMGYSWAMAGCPGATYGYAGIL